MESRTIQLFLRESFKKHKDRIAVQDKILKISYELLEKMISSVSNYLVSINKRKQVKIGILVNSRLDLIVSILGTIFSRNIFIPFSNKNNEQLSYYFDSIELDYLIIDKNNINYLSSFKTNFEIILLESIVNYESDFKSDLKYSPEDGLYIYFSSGSSGKKKPILGRNVSLLQFVKWQSEIFEIEENSNFSQLITPMFDASLRDMFLPLFVGGSICYSDDYDDLMTKNGIKKYLEQFSITHIHCVPSVFEVFGSKDLKTSDLKSVKYVFMSGERIMPKKLNNWFKIIGDRTKLVNFYGATETTMIRSSYVLNFSDVENDRIPIGKPIRGTRFIVLDQNKNICRPGVVGELYIRTAFGTFGYYGLDDLNKTAFIQNPLDDSDDILLYKTGDKVVQLEDGNYDLLGRLDRMVKIQGRVVFLDDIERELNKIDKISKSVVVFNEERKLLIAFYEADKDYSNKYLRGMLENKLPETFIPGSFLCVERIPVLENGKIDYQTLQKEVYKFENEIEEEYQNDIEYWLIGIFNRIFELEERKVNFKTSFFELGGNSLNALSLASVINEKYKIDVKLKEIYANSTIEQLSELIKFKSTITSKDKFLKVERKEYYPLTPEQKRFFFICNDLLGNSAYINQKYISIEKGIANYKVEKAVRDLVDHHLVLKTRIKYVNGKPCMVYEKYIDFKIENLNCSNKDDLQDNISKLIEEIQVTNFPLFKLCIIEYEGVCKLFFAVHHIISDGISFSIFERDLNLFLENQSLKPHQYNFFDYANYRSKKGENNGNRNQSEGEYSIDVAEPINLPLDYARPYTSSFKGKTVSFELNKELTENIRSMSRSGNISIYSILLSGFSILLYKLSNQDSFCISSLKTSRENLESDDIFGLLICTLVYYYEFEKSFTIKDVIDLTHSKVLAMLDDSDFDFDRLIDSNLNKRDLSVNSAFQTFFNFLNYKKNKEIDDVMLKFSGIHRITDVKCDLSVICLEYKDVIKINFEYSTDLFKSETIDHFIRYYVGILGRLQIDNQMRISQIDLADELDRKRILNEFNFLNKNYAKDKCLNRLLNNKRDIHHDSIAISQGNLNITYAELDREVNNLSCYLKSKGIGRNTFVGVALDRSIELIIALHAITKAGAAFIPIDTNYPHDRIKYIIEDSAIRFAIVNEKSRHLIDGVECIIDDKETLFNQNLDYSLVESETINEPSDLLYLIYTSGSTGKPKGVMIDHVSFVHRLEWIQERYPMEKYDNILMKTSISFDVSLWEIYWWAYVGSKLIILKSEEEKNPKSIYETIQKDQVSVLQFVPSMLRIFIDYLEKNVEAKDLMLLSVKYIISIGEKLLDSDVEKFRTLFNEKLGVKLVNMYGPAEATVNVTDYDCTLWNGTDEVSIGKPIENVKIYILDSENRLLPTGLKGQLAIAGVGLARGYLNRQELTTEKFITDLVDINSKMYLTGDIAKWKHNGDIEFVGRKDFQVKLRGHRIELGEIEFHLNSFDNVVNSVVIVTDDNLCAYYMSEREIKDEELRNYLKNYMPEYMIPMFFMQLEKLPLSQSGKIDRNKLPKISLKKKDKYQKPGNQIEEELVSIWSNILGVEEDKIGINDSFLNLGGHSLKIAQLLGQILNKYETKVTFHEFILEPTILGISNILKKGSRSNVERMINTEKKDYYPIANSQIPFFVQSQLNKNSISYNVPLQFILQGNIDLKKLKYSFEQLVDNNEILRSNFVYVGKDIVQKIKRSDSFCVEILDGESQPKENIVESFIRPFSLHTGWLFRVSLFPMSINKYMLLMDFHHIITDRVSISLLLKEFAHIYNGIAPVSKRFDFKDYSEWENSSSSMERTLEMEKYWSIRMKDYEPAIYLPYDFPRPANINIDLGELIDKEIDADLSKQILDFAKREKVTPFSFLYSVFSILLSKYSGINDIVVATPVAGRSNPETYSIVGVFLNILLLRSFPHEGMQFRDFLNQTSNDLYKDFERQNYPFNRIVKFLGEKKNSSKTQLVNIEFAFRKAEELDVFLNEVEVLPYKHEVYFSKYDLFYLVIQESDKLKFRIRYSPELYKQGTIINLNNQFIQIIHQVLDNPKIKLGDIDLINLLIKAKDREEFQFENFNL